MGVPVVLGAPQADGIVRGFSHCSVQRGAAQRTWMWPPRDCLAVAHSHGRHSITTVPGCQGWPRQHCIGKPGQVVACCWLMTVFKHIIEVMTLTPVLVGREVCSLSSRLTTEAALEARAQTL